MTAVIRLKRHLEDEPLSALILNCKKRKKCEEEDNVSEVSTVLAFAGTINTQEDDISSHISRLSKDELENTYKKHIPNITSKLKQDAKEAAENSRFKVVNFFRSIDKQKIESDEPNKDHLPLTVLDVETDIVDDTYDESDFVYDLYYSNADDIYTEFDSEIRICPANEVIFEDNILTDSEHDSDDSNAENNWRNDYPDEEEDDSLDEGDMRKAMNSMSLDNLSSDEEQAGFSYSNDNDALDMEEDLVSEDGIRYGELYARFKSRQKKEEDKYNRDMHHDDTDDLSD